MICAFHGNTDAILVFFVLLAIHLADSGRPSWAAGLALGAAICCKVVPLILIPAFAFYFRSTRRIAQFLAALAGCVMVCWSPYLFQDPEVVLASVFGYRSVAGTWGLSWILARIAVRVPVLAPILSAYIGFGSAALFLLIGALSFWMSRRPQPRALFAQCGIVMLLFIALAPGFGVQYLAWVLPWVILLGASGAALLFSTSAVFLFAVYNLWAGGLPWYLADAIQTGTWRGTLALLQFPCWLSVAISAWLVWKDPSPRPIRWLWAAAFAVASLIIYSLSGQPLLRRADAPSPRVALQRIRATGHVDLSSVVYRRGNYSEAVAEARAALRLQPDLAAAWNDLAAAYVALGDWDNTIVSARAALRLNPGLKLAQQNLIRALAAKARSQPPAQ